MNQSEIEYSEQEWTYRDFVKVSRINGSPCSPTLCKSLRSLVAANSVIPSNRVEPPRASGTQRGIRAVIWVPANLDHRSQIQIRPTEYSIRKASSSCALAVLAVVGGFNPSAAADDCPLQAT